MTVRMRHTMLHMLRALALLVLCACTTGFADEPVPVWTETAEQLKERGDQALANDNTDDALIYYQKALKRDPNYVDALIGKAKCHIERGDLSAAKQLLTRATEIDEKSHLAWAYLGNVHYNMGQGSIQATVAKHGPDTASELLKKVDDLGYGDLRKAITYYLKAADLSKKAVFARLAARTAFLMEDMDRAVSLCNKAAGMEPSGKKSKKLLAELHERHRYRVVKRVLRKLRRNRLDPELLARAFTLLHEASTAGDSRDDAKEADRKFRLAEECLRHHRVSLRGKDYLFPRETADLLVATVSLQLGRTRLRQGILNKAISYFQNAYTLADKRGYDGTKAEAYIGLGDAYTQLGDYERALSYHKRSLILARKNHHDVRVADTCRHMARLYRFMGNDPQAEEHFRKALKILKKLDHHTKLALLNVEYGLFLLDTIGYEPSMEVFIEHGEQEDTSIMKEGKARVANGMSLLAELPDDTDISESEYAEAWDIFLESLIRYRLLSAEAQDNIKKWGKPEWKARILLYEGKFKAAKRLYTEVLNTLGPGSDFSLLAGCRLALGRANEALHNYTEAAASYQKAINLLEEKRSQLGPEERKRFFNARSLWSFRTAPYEGLARILVKQGKYEKALSYSEKTKARFFSEQLSAQLHSLPKEIPELVSETDRELNDKLAALSKEIKLAYLDGFRTKVERLKAQQDRAGAELNAHVAALHDHYPLFAATLYPESITLRRMAVTDEDRIVSYDVTEHGLLIFLCQGKRIKKAVVKPVSRTELNRLVTSIRIFIDRRSRGSVFVKTSSDAAHILLDGIIDEIPEGKKIIIIPDESLGKLPFEALCLTDGGEVVITDAAGQPLTDDKLKEKLKHVRNDDTDILGAGDIRFTVRGASFLGDRNPVSLYQSLRVLSLTRIIGQPVRSAKRLLVFADPILGAEDPRVSPKNGSGTSERDRYAGGRAAYSDELVKSLKKMYGSDADFVTGKDATKKRLLEDYADKLDRYSAILFDTHGGYLGGAREAGLELGGEKLGDAAFLTSSEVISDMKMEADLVVLSACRTARGRMVAGEGTFGLARAFQVAGSGSVVGTLWKVNSKATVLMMTHFFREYRKGADKLTALRSAKQAIRSAGFDHPYFWAGIVLYGRAGDEGTFDRSLLASKDPSGTEASLSGLDSKEKRLLEACKKGYLSTVKELLETGVDPSCVDEEHSGTPLHWAVWAGHAEIVTLLLEHGAEVNVTNADGRTPLIVAAGLGRAAIVDRLIEAGADKSVKDKEDKTALDWAEARDHTRIVKLLK